MTFVGDDEIEPLDGHGGVVGDVAGAIAQRLGEFRAGEIVGELVLAIKQGTPLRTLADVIHPFPAFNRVLGGVLDELAAKAAASRNGGQP